MICLLTVSLDIGGAEMQVVSLAKELQTRGWHPFVVSLLAADGRLAQELQSCNVEVQSLGMRRGVPDPRAILRLRSILRRRTPMLVHSHTINANFLARATRLICPIPVLVSTIHSVNEGGTARQLIYRITDSLSDLTTAVSAAAAKRSTQRRAVSSQRMHMLPNGLDLDRFYRNDHKRATVRKQMQLDGKFVWLAVGRFEYPKDYPNMLRAFARVQDSNSILLLAGTGSLMHEAQKLVDQLRLTANVHMLGQRSDVAELMNAADAYVMSSRWEGLPMVLLEAAASELPIVASRVGGNAEVVQDGTTGALVPAENPEALAKAMEWVMSLPETERRSLGEHGRRFVTAHYSLVAIVDRWEAVYRDLLRTVGRETAVSA